MAHKTPRSFSPEAVTQQATDAFTQGVIDGMKRTQFDVQIKGMREVQGPNDDGFRVFSIDDVPMLDLDNHAMFELLTASGVEETIVAAAIDKMSEFIHTETIARLIAKRIKR